MDIEFQIDFVLIESDKYTKFIGPVQANSSFITHLPSNQLCRTFDQSMNFLSKIIETSYFGGWTSMHGLMAGRAYSILHASPVWFLCATNNIIVIKQPPYMQELPHKINTIKYCFLCLLLVWISWNQLIMSTLRQI